MKILLVIFIIGFILGMLFGCQPSDNCSKVYPSSYNVLEYMLAISVEYMDDASISNKLSTISTFKITIYDEDSNEYVLSDDSYYLKHRFIHHYLDRFNYANNNNSDDAEIIIDILIKQHLINVSDIKSKPINDDINEESKGAVFTSLIEDDLLFDLKNRKSYEKKNGKKADAIYTTMMINVWEKDTGNILYRDSLDSVMIHSSTKEEKEKIIPTGWL
jgi:hypothetical protein